MSYINASRLLLQLRRIILSNKNTCFKRHFSANTNQHVNIGELIRQVSQLIESNKNQKRQMEVMDKQMEIMDKQREDSLKNLAEINHKLSLLDARQIFKNLINGGTKRKKNRKRAIKNDYEKLLNTFDGNVLEFQRHIHDASAYSLYGKKVAKIATSLIDCGISIAHPTIKDIDLTMFNDDEQAVIIAAIRSLELSEQQNAASADQSGEVLLKQIKNKLVITLNRPKASNALNLAMIRKIYEQLKKSSDLVLIKGQGNKAFCAGVNVFAVHKSYTSRDPENQLYQQLFKEEYKLDHLIGTLKQPYVALIDGITMGGGCGLSMHGAFRVATERTKLAMPEIAYGWFSDVGGTYFLPRLSGELGMFLALTGYQLNGSDVYRASLATHYVESAHLLRLENDLLCLSTAECTQENVDQLLQRFQPQSIASFSLDPHLDLIDECFGGDSVEECMHRLEQKAHGEGNEFAREQLETLNKMSPTSLKVTFHQIRKGRELSFPQVFPIEYLLTQRFLADHDFGEGCRAILIDKDKNPKWKPATLAEVSDAKIDAYFAPIDDPKLELDLFADDE